MFKSLTTNGRRLVRFRLRTLFILTTVIAILLGVWVTRVARAKRQAEGVKALRDRSANAYYDFQRNGQNWDRSAPPPGPAWLRERMGIDFLATAVHVEIRSNHIKSGRIRDIGKDSPPWTKEADLVHLAELPGIVSLEVDGAPFSDVAMLHIGRTGSLERVVLRLQNEYDNQPGFIHANVGISDAGLAHISGLRHLKSLSISNVYRRGGPTITDAGMVLLSRLSRLEILSLHNRGIRGPGLAQLQRLPHLREILLLDPVLADSALDELRKVPSLRKLSLWGVPNVTDDAVREFIREMPNCQVEYQYKNPQ